MEVKYEETYGINGVELYPMCPKCNEPTYSMDICPFCKTKLEYKEVD